MPNDPQAKTFTALRELGLLTQDLQGMLNRDSNPLDVWVKLKEISRMSDEAADLLMYQRTVYPGSSVPRATVPMARLFEEEL